MYLCGISHSVKLCISEGNDKRDHGQSVINICSVSHGRNICGNDKRDHGQSVIFVVCPMVGIFVVCPMVGSTVPWWEYL